MNPVQQQTLLDCVDELNIISERLEKLFFELPGESAAAVAATVHGIDAATYILASFLDRFESNSR